MSELYEFHEPGPIARLRKTPLSDAMRGNITGTLDPRVVIANAALPAPLPSIVYTVVRRSRLWRREKLDVARELIGHFADGLETGRTPEQLATQFGSPKQAAQLIRQAKRRSRPWWWQLWHLFAWILVWSAVAATLIYAGLALRFYLGRPVVARNYWQEINQARQAPESERAWPIYRDALLAVGPDKNGKIDPDELAGGPDSEKWKQAAALLDRHRNAIARIRAGASKPHFGWYLGDPADLEIVKNQNANWLGASGPTADENKELISASLFAVQDIRMLARLLVMDARVAAARGDGGTAMADLMALISLSEQLFPPGATLVEQLVGVAIFGLATESLGRVLVDSPAALTDDQLRVLAHRLAAYRQGNFTLDFRGERMLFDDILQRAYTDDGAGDGRLTPEGVKMLAEFADVKSGLFRMLVAPSSQDPGSDVALSRLISPGVAALVGNRRENREFYESALDELIALHQGQPWQWNREKIDAATRQLETLDSGDQPRRFRYYFVARLLPAIDAIFSASERSVQVRDAAEVAIALVLWQRKHGQWPQQLDQLVPDLLPAVPPDRVDGRSLRYTVRDGRPLIYSLGADYQDNDGRPTTPNPDSAYAFKFGDSAPMSTPTPDKIGDLVLWPAVEVKVEDPPEPVVDE